ncbi:MAG: hypothetical protein VCB43_01845 [Myxococcota bacterium]
MTLRAVITLLSISLLTLVFALATGAGAVACAVDADGDGVCDDPGPTADNCTAVANADQRDDDQDGYGNKCDADVNQDCAAGAPDIAAITKQSGAGTSNDWNGDPAIAAYDINCDDMVGAPDVTTAFGAFGTPPGPSARTCADCYAIPLSGICP